MEKSNTNRGNKLALQNGEKQKSSRPQLDNTLVVLKVRADMEDLFFSSDPPVVLLVGGPSSPSPKRQAKTIYAPENLLTRSSPFFRAALQKYQPPAIPGMLASQSSGFLESKTRTILMPEDRADDVQYFVQWLHTALAFGVFGRTATTAEGTLANEFICRTDTIDIERFLTPTLQENLREGREYRANLRTYIAQSCSTKSNEKTPTRPKKHRPDPPAFGPLIRLYLFTEKYLADNDRDTEGQYLGLRDLMVDAVRHVATETRSVPRREDVDLLFADVGVLARGKELRGMRRLVVDLFVGMKNCGALLKGEETEKLKRPNHFAVSISTETTQDPTSSSSDFDSDSDVPTYTEGLYNPSFLTEVAIASLAETSRLTALGIYQTVPVNGSDICGVVEGVGPWPPISGSDGGSVCRVSGRFTGRLGAKGLGGQVAVQSLARGRCFWHHHA